MPQDAFSIMYHGSVGSMMDFYAFNVSHMFNLFSSQPVLSHFGFLKKAFSTDGVLFLFCQKKFLPGNFWLVCKVLKPWLMLPPAWLTKLF